MTPLQIGILMIIGGFIIGIVVGSLIFIAGLRCIRNGYRKEPADANRIILGLILLPVAAGLGYAVAVNIALWGLSFILQPPPCA